MQFIHMSSMTYKQGKFKQLSSVLHENNADNNSNDFHDKNEFITDDKGEEEEFS